MTTSVASTYGMSKTSVPVWTATTGHLRALRRPQLLLVLLDSARRRAPGQAGSVLDTAADADGAGRRAARELLLELLRERAADQQRPRVLAPRS